jgi:hypothetical protein
MSPKRGQSISISAVVAVGLNTIMDVFMIRQKGISNTELHRMDIKRERSNQY